jgi:N-acetylneuraminic acid mutarotase
MAFSRWSTSLFCGALLSVSQALYAQGSWVARASLPSTRNLPGVAVLNGKIYAVGGFTSNTTCDTTAAVEEYDPVADTWTSRAPLPTPRFGVSLVAANGFLYSIGGGAACGQIGLTEVDRYDPSTNTWTVLTPINTLGRSSAYAALIGNRIYIAGGHTGFTNTASAIYYDLSSNTTTGIPPLPSSRHAGASAAVGQDFYVIGGAPATGSNLNEVLAYNESAGGWLTHTAMPSPLASMAGAASGTLIYVAGGGPTPQFSVFDTATQAWSALPQMRTPRANAGVVVFGGNVYTIGGMGPVVEMYLPNTPSYNLTVSVTGSGRVTSAPAGIDCTSGTCQAPFLAGQAVTLTATPGTEAFFAGWSNSPCAALVNPCTLTMTGALGATASFGVNKVILSANPASLAFGGQSMNTSAPDLSVSIRNDGGIAGAVTLGTLAAPFSSTHDCGTLQPGQSCSATVSFRPTAATGYAVSLTADAPSATQLSIPVTGTGERSLATHYYRSILRRAPDAGGKAFWESEATRLTNLGADANEAWYAMAMSFYFSPEYLGLNRNPTEFVRDLYNTFFNRAPDPGGLAFWTGQIDSGVPREVVLAGFMFSDEFRQFSEKIFGTQSVRPEVNMTMDFYRGWLSRLPDTGGLNFYVNQFRLAQCLGTNVLPTIRDIAATFLTSPEYANRARTNGQYVGDLYNGFMRRGGDSAGVLNWISALQSGVLTRDGERDVFFASPEFQSRAAQVVAAACIPTTCDVTLSGTSQRIATPPEGGTGTFRVEAPPGCSWTASPGASWLTVSRDGDHVNYTVAPNNTTSGRVATIDVRSTLPGSTLRTFGVGQNGRLVPVTDICLLAGKCNSNGICCDRGWHGCTDFRGVPMCYPTFGGAVAAGCTTVATVCPN